MSPPGVDSTLNPCAVCKSDGQSTMNREGLYVRPQVVDGTIFAEAADDAFALKESLSIESTLVTRT